MCTVSRIALQARVAEIEREERIAAKYAETAAGAAERNAFRQQAERLRAIAGRLRAMLR